MSEKISLDSSGLNYINKQEQVKPTPAMDYFAKSRNNSYP